MSSLASRRILTGSKHLAALDSDASIFPNGMLASEDAVNIPPGELGVPRLTNRSSQVVSFDRTTARFAVGSIQSPTDIRVRGLSDSLADAVVPESSFFDGSDAGFTLNPRYIYIPMSWMESARISVFHALDKTTQYSLFGLPSGVNTTQEVNGACRLDTISIPPINHHTFHWGIGEAGQNGGNTYRTVNAIAAGWAYLVVKVDPAESPEAGQFWIDIRRTAV